MYIPLGGIYVKVKLGLDSGLSSRLEAFFSDLLRIDFGGSESLGKTD